jgi:asparagine synthase (glutamine-hydrolysing)
VSVNARGSVDSAKASRSAELVGIESLQIEANASGLKTELEALDLPFEGNLMDRSLWCIYSLASRAAAKAGAETILLGQLADELFGGYEKYQKTLAQGGESAAALMMDQDVAGCGTRGFLRDEGACARWLEPRFPYADTEVLAFGKAIPVGFKIRSGVRKAVLREAAKKLGVPAELADAPKKAAQYSSGVQKLVARS